MQAKTRHIKVLGFGVTYIRDFTVCIDFKISKMLTYFPGINHQAEEYDDAHGKQQGWGY